MITLSVDGAVGAGTIAVFEGDTCRAEREVPMGARSGDPFFPAVLDALREAGTRASLVTRVIVGAGPGRFTSVRIVAAIAKGVAEGAGAALVAVPSLALAAAAADSLAPGRYLAVADALRGEWFAQGCERHADGRVTVDGPARRVAAEVAAAAALAQGARLLGARPDDGGRPHARGALRLVAGGCGVAVDVATWEPAYGRMAEAQVQWEAVHGRPLPAA